MDKEENNNASVVEDVAPTTVETAVAVIAETDNKMITKDNEEKQSDDCSKAATAAAAFQLRTIRPGSINSERRVGLLPAYPLARNDEHRRVLLLLSNVPNVDRNQCEKESFCGGNGVCPFEFKQHHYVEPIDSFMMDLYQDLFIEPSRQWKIHYSLIDYNLSRLRKCMDIYTKQTKEPAISSFNELLLALEFFLQIDVDIFFMKTCNFGGAHPRLFRGKNANTTEEQEGILCQAKPQVRYGMNSCNQRHCALCESRPILSGRITRTREESNEFIKVGVQFSSNQTHIFVNKYEAILNCHANCTTSNIIYALTCPCGQWDYIDSTSISFNDRISKHREENNRIVREFLIGTNNINHILKQESRSAQTLANNNMRLYQHSLRCPIVLQHFLDKNPEYWCLVPMLCEEARADDNAAAIGTYSSSSDANNIYIATNQLQPESPTFVKKPKLFFEPVLRNSTRSREECIWLAKGIPKAPSGYRFSRRQIDKQMDFFKFKKEAHILPSNLVDFYKYTIIAVLPDDCSQELRRFVEALFITHAETKLNTIGRLTHKGSWPSLTTAAYNHSNREIWCEKLVRCC